jgi:hypothetical protein
MDPDQSICYVYRPVRQVTRCICIKMLYITSGDIFYLCLILLNRKARSDKDILTYITVHGGGKPIVCTISSNLPLHMVTLIALLMYVRHTMICVQMAWEHSAGAIL